MARRARGEGSITRRPDGRWQVALTISSANGRQQRKYFYARSQREARERLTVERARLQQGLLPPPERQTVADYLRHWLAAVARHRLRPTTYRRYEELVRLHALPALGALPLAKLTPQHLERLYTERLQAGLSPRSVEFLHAVLRAALKHAVRQGLVVRAATDGVRAPRPTRGAPQALDAAQARQLLAAARGTELEGLITLALATGMRQGELLALRWQDVDLARGVLHVRHTLQWRTGGRFELAAPKTARARRTIRLPATAIEALRRQRARLAEWRLQAGPAWQEHDLVFPRADGRPLAASTLQHGQFPRLLAAAGLPRIRFHDLRHTYATLALRGGISPRVVQETLGHSSVTLTLDTYSHVLPDVQAQAAATIDAVLRRA